jgi:hypothetical protein
MQPREHFVAAGLKNEWSADLRQVASSLQKYNQLSSHFDSDVMAEIILNERNRDIRPS